jgi:hypothetical protein
MGPVLASLAIIGLVWTSWHARPLSWVPSSFAAAVLVIQPLALFFWAGRYAAAAYPVLLLAASALLVDACRYVARSSPWKFPAEVSGALSALALLLIAGTNLKTLLTHEEALLRPPTRELARAWIETELPEGTKLILNSQYVSPVLLNCADPGYFNPHRRDRRPCFDVAYLPLPNIADATADEEADIAQRALGELTGDGLAYVIYTDEMPPVTRARLGRPNRLRSLLDTRYEFVVEFFYRDLTNVPDDTATVNPKVRIYRVGDATRPKQ